MEGWDQYVYLLSVQCIVQLLCVHKVHVHVLMRFSRSYMYVLVPRGYVTLQHATRFTHNVASRYTFYAYRACVVAHEL